MKAHIIEFPKILDPRGNLTFLQSPQQIPFQIKRVFWTYDVPGGEQRGGHAFRQQEEIIIALSGSFDVVITNTDGNSEKFFLNRSYYGIYVPALTWRHMENFSTNALSVHLSSMVYSASDYIYSIEEFKGIK
ncbi:FdtA/QdtA family cupin domain-containing protein [uncultured Pontibacter sp.]|uniref:sugar 3,4-ketoisomerase n=1 Tax=uncultured Pontibacter sp. TaxID=453356 RepID=UPI002625E4F9|nr:FdtA/QdtA family cupin domain-containing protein [uncultured Pontibacter sp.]